MKFQQIQSQNQNLPRIDKPEPDPISEPEPEPKPESVEVIDSHVQKVEWIKLIGAPPKPTDIGFWGRDGYIQSNEQAKAITTGLDGSIYITGSTSVICMIKLITVDIKMHLLVMRYRWS